MDADHQEITIQRQCELLGLSRSAYYYEPAGESLEDLKLMRLIDEQYLRTPFFGSRQMATWLGVRLDEAVNRKRVQRMMRVMGIEAIYPRARTTRRNLEHRVFPYLLRDVAIIRKDQVWSTDISVPQKRRERWEFGLPQSACRSRLQTTMSGCG